GFRYVWDAAGGQFAHVAVVTVLTPDGRIARYFPGIEYPARDLRLALVEASEGRIGTVVDRLLLFCYRYDAASGRYTPMIARAVVPLGIFLFTYVWGASIYFWAYTPPTDALEVYGVGKQWMWKFQHLSGQREIDELHVPVARPVKVLLTSQDVIHSFSVPDFRVKQDAIPGRYTEAWFEATLPGTYHLFCAEYCGTLHSQMIGSVVAMEPAAFEQWLAGGVTASPAERGQKL